MESEVQKGEETLDLAGMLKAQGELESVWRGRGMDWLLQSVVRWSNKSDREQFITLHTPSGVVSGTLIPHKAYFKAFADEYLGVTTGDDAEKLRDMIAAYGAPSQDEEDPYDDVQFIHMRNAKFFVPGQNPMPSNGILWRGKISAVCSFNLGRFGTD